MAGDAAAERRAVEARIAAELARLTGPGEPGAAPPAYVRRHAVEHAAAGGVLDERFLSWEFLPHVDAGRLRAVSGAGASEAPVPGSPGGELLRVWRKAAHAWDWDDPRGNALALWLFGHCAGVSGVVEACGGWRMRWAEWPVEEGELVARYVGPATGAVLPDGRAVAIVGDLVGDASAVRILDLATGQMIGEPLTGHTEGVCALSALTLPDGRSLALVGDGGGALRMWDLTTGQPLGEPLTIMGPVALLAPLVLPDGRAVAVSGNGSGEITRWDLTTARRIGEPLTSTASVGANAAAVLLDARAVVLTALHDKVLLRDMLSEEPVDRLLTRHSTQVTALAALVLPDGRPLALVGGQDGAVEVWDLTTSRRYAHCLIDGSAPITSLAGVALPDGRIIAIACNKDDLVYAWDVASIPPSAPRRLGVAFWVAGLLLPDGRAVAITSGAGTRVWDLLLKASAEESPGVPPGFCTLAAVPLADGRAIAFTITPDDRTVRVRDLGTGRREARPLTGYKSHINVVAAATLADGRTLAVTDADDTSALVWTVRRNARPRRRGRLQGHSDYVSAIDALALPDGRALAVTGSLDRTVRLWNLTTGRPVGEPMTGHDTEVRRVALLQLPDGGFLVLSCSKDGSVWRWDPTTGETAFIPHRFDPQGDTLSAAVLPSGRPFAVTSARSAAQVWDCMTGELICDPLTGHTGWVTATATVVLPDGRVLVVTGSMSGDIRLWDVGTMRAVGDVLRAPGPVTDIAAVVTGSELTLLVGGWGFFTITTRLDT
ncbi:WD40 repeat domain-containing protein [Streptomyces sp. S.PNR 29]|uniref:WD40 repeat domain-containing protein n=1 Tax=Streptomyces sp. S.PNR 29 TaxID=2973805 RepID=UPI0025B0FC88|nr:WD40 repeat domain-containing protein [Streptomyces sp. S.PNR 29]MDN0193658.1 WD40 repeat domain-containing protein [Streptomyces sp. S.PNR 29]